MASWGPKLIPRKTFNARRREEVTDEFGLVDETYVSFTVDNAGAQPVTGYESSALPEGYRDKNVYKVFTTTYVRPSEEGTENYADQIEVEGGKWFTVIKVQNWSYGLQSHYLAYVVEENER